jgi:hypothetical protein
MIRTGILAALLLAAAASVTVARPTGPADPADSLEAPAWAPFFAPLRLDGGGSEPQEREGFRVSDHWRGRLQPRSDLYPRAIADPLRPMISFHKVWITENHIPESGDNRFQFRLGGRFGLLRLHHTGDPDRGFQLDLEAAFVGIFDIENSLDNIGWDGIYGLLFSWADGEGLAAKLATRHDSSHVGDEYAERTGRTRIDHTREEAMVGVSHAGGAPFRFYGEAAYGFTLRNEDLQEPWRIRGGVEYEEADRFFGGSAGPFAAIDVNAFEENDWQADVTIQVGLVVPTEGIPRTWRFGIEYRDGRSLIGEFFDTRERYVGIGVWFEP